MNSNVLSDFYAFLKSMNWIRSQEELAEKLDYSKMQLSRFLKGKYAIPKEFEMKIKNVFSVEWNEYLKYPDGNKLTTTHNKNGNEYKELPSGEYLVTVDLVPFEAHARYLSDDIEEFGEWQKVSFVVDRIGKGNYKAFKHKGDSMFNDENPSFYDTPNGAMSLCRELGRHHWKDGFYAKNAEFGWILITNKNILHKDIIDFNKETGDIICHSRNKSPQYSDFNINLDEIRQIFKIIKRTF